MEKNNPTGKAELYRALLALRNDGADVLSGKAGAVAGIGPESAAVASCPGKVARRIVARRGC